MLINRHVPCVEEERDVADTLRVVTYWIIREDGIHTQNA